MTARAHQYLIEIGTPRGRLRSEARSRSDTGLHVLGLVSPSACSTRQGASVPLVA
jgi:hypothetical protein